MTQAPILITNEINAKVKGKYFLGGVKALQKRKVDTAGFYILHIILHWKKVPPPLQYRYNLRNVYWLCLDYGTNKKTGKITPARDSQSKIHQESLRTSAFLQVSSALQHKNVRRPK